MNRDIHGPLHIPQQAEPTKSNTGLHHTLRSTATGTNTPNGPMHKVSANSITKPLTMGVSEQMSTLQPRT
eukprot:93173-Amphidinium_carterae.1